MTWLRRKVGVRLSACCDDETRRATVAIAGFVRSVRFITLDQRGGSRAGESSRPSK